MYAIVEYVSILRMNNRGITAVKNPSKQMGNGASRVLGSG